jgi:hypothetical protein
MERCRILSEIPRSLHKNNERIHDYLPIKLPADLQAGANVLLHAMLSLAARDEDALIRPSCRAQGTP